MSEGEVGEEVEEWVGNRVAVSQSTIAGAGNRSKRSQGHLDRRCRGPAGAHATTKPSSNSLVPATPGRRHHPLHPNAAAPLPAKQAVQKAIAANSVVGA